MPTISASVSKSTALAGVLVAERDAEVGRRQGGQGEQAQRREDGLVGGDRQEVFHPPVEGGNFGWTRWTARSSACPQRDTLTSLRG